MGKFRDWVENQDYMAKGTSMQSNLPVARRIVGLNVVDGLSPTQIAKDPEVASQGGMPHPGSISRLLKQFGLNKEVQSMIRAGKQSASSQSQKDYDKYHNRNTFGTNPDRAYMPQRYKDAMEGMPIPQEIAAQHAVPKGFMKVLDKNGMVHIKPDTYTLGPGESQFKPLSKFYAKAPRNQKKGVVSFDDYMAQKQGNQPANQPASSRNSLRKVR